MLGNYIILTICCFGVFISIFKIKNNISFRLLVIAASIEGILVSIAKIMSIRQTMNYPIVILGVLLFIMMTYKAWKIRKIPGKKFAAYFWLIGMPCLVSFALIMYILIESGMFGE